MKRELNGDRMADSYAGALPYDVLGTVRCARRPGPSGLGGALSAQDAQPARRRRNAAVRKSFASVSHQRAVGSASTIKWRKRFRRRTVSAARESRRR